MILVLSQSATKAEADGVTSPAVPIPQDDKTEKSTLLYGRVNDFLSPGGPSFPAFYGSNAKQDDNQTDVPSDIRGTWHGDIEVQSCRATEQCFRWNSGFALQWSVFQNRKGPGIFEFAKGAKGSELKSGYTVFRFPLRENKDTYRRIIEKLSNPTPQQIAVVDQAIAPLTLPIKLSFGGKSKHGKVEVLANDITIKELSQVTRQRQLSSNAWEWDCVSKRTVRFQEPKKSEIIYTESVTTVIKLSDGTLYFQNAGGRYTEDKQPLCYLVVGGRLIKGEVAMPATNDVSIDLIPAAGGVLLTAIGAPENHANVLIPNARLK